MKRVAKQREKSFFDLSLAEREKELARFDRPIDLDKETRPLTKKERARFERSVADTPHVSIYVKDRGGCDVVVLLDDDLLDKARQYAQKKKTTLPKMIDRGLRGLLSFDA